MSLSRRAFFRNLGVDRADSVSPNLIASRGREALELWRNGLDYEDGFQNTRMTEGAIVISSNENPLGPGPAAYQALLDGLTQQAGRYPTNFRPSHRDLMQTIANQYGARPENITLGTGSGEILENGALAFTSPDKALVTADPSYLQAVGVARRQGHAIRTVSLDANLRLDSEAIARAASGAGLVFLCNPNNPSSTVMPASDVEALVAEVRRSSPDTYILIDEAYHDYVTDPAHQTAIPLALRTPKVFVARTFSKAYSLCFQRIGYAIGHAELLEQLMKVRDSYSVNGLAQVAALATLSDRRYYADTIKRIVASREQLAARLGELGFGVLPSETNFLLVEPPGRSAEEWFHELRERRILVRWFSGRRVRRYLRITIGTEEEIERLVREVERLLRA